MRFTETLRYNQVDAWSQHYIEYKRLKDILYKISELEETLLPEHEYVVDVGDVPLSARSSAPGTSSLIGAVGNGRRASSGCRASFDDYPTQALLESSHQVRRDLDRLRQEFREAFADEVAKSSKFVVDKEQELTTAWTDLRAEVNAQLCRHADQETAADGNGEAVEEYQLMEDFSEAQRSEWAERAQRLYVEIHNLKMFVLMNRDGFRKILKKNDKVTSQSMMDVHMPRVNERFSQALQQRLENMLRSITQLHANAKNRGAQRKSAATLQLSLPDMIQYDRGTVWRHMIALERLHNPTAVARAADSTAVFKPDEMYRKTMLFVIAFALYLLVAALPVMETPQQKRCLAMVVTLSYLWVTEAIPLYVTSMLVPVLTVVLRVLPAADLPPHQVPGDPNDVPSMLPKDAAPIVFKAMFNDAILILLGGFSIASAMSKYNIDKAIARAVLSRVSSPADVLLAIMFVATFLSCWISNVAAPVLCFGLIEPVLEQYARPKPNMGNFNKALVMGIAMASNVGGMTSPIASPQNVFAIELMAKEGPSWLQWFAVSIPVSFCCLICIWVLLRIFYQPGRGIESVKAIRKSTSQFTFVQGYVIFISVLTVLLWCVNNQLAPILGDQGVIAFLPLIAFFGSGTLNKDDWNDFLWHVVMLAQGGMVLSTAVKGSGMLTVVARAIKHATDGESLWFITAVFCLLVVFCTTFISHTVGAMVILPVVQTVGQQLGGGSHDRLMVMAGALMCSGAMGLPISGFPNITASALQDELGNTWVKMQDFLMVGIPSSLIAWCIIITVGFFVMYVIGF